MTAVERFSLKDIGTHFRIGEDHAPDPDEIRRNLLMQLTAPVRWTQTVENMVADGADTFIEVGPGSVLQGLVKKIAPEGTEISGIA